MGASASDGVLRDLTVRSAADVADIPQLASLARLQPGKLQTVPCPCRWTEKRSLFNHGEGTRLLGERRVATMAFRRTGHGDERRRRVLLDEMRGTNSAGSDGGPEAAVTRRASAAIRSGKYSTAALASHQPPVTCLIPKRMWTLAVMFLGGASAIAGLESLYGNVYANAHDALLGPLVALDAAARGSLMSWLSSLFLDMAAIGSIMVYSLRRHRLDDYRGRYRIWLCAGALCVLGSIDVVTGLHVALASQLTELSGTPLYGDGRVWWIAVAAVLVGTTFLRFSVEMRTCPSAVACLLLAGAGYVTGALIELDLLFPDGGAFALMVQSSCLMFAHLFVVLAIASYCRRVYHQAQGELPERRKRRSKEGDDTTTAQAAAKNAGTARASASIRFDAAHDGSGSTSRSDDLSPALPEPNEEETADGSRRLSKSERRRLRKQLRDQDPADR